MKFPLVFLCALFALSSPCLAGETYKWIDQDGNTHFTDNLFNIPGEGLSSVKVYRELENERESYIPLRKTSGGYLVEALVDDSWKVNLLLDTGASATVISPAALKNMGYEVKNDPPVEMHTAGGTVRAGWADLKKVSVGGAKKEKMRIVAHDAVSGVDGLLGMDFLGAFRVEIISSGPSLKLSTP